jgi:hypothetical protein
VLKFGFRIPGRICIDLLPFPELFYLPPIALCRPTLEIERPRLRPELGSNCFPLLSAGIGLTVQFLCLGSRAAFAGKRQHLDYILLLSDVNGEHISDRYSFGRFDAHLIDINLTALDSICCQGACFKESRGAKPLVDAEFFIIVESINQGNAISKF